MVANENIGHENEESSNTTEDTENESVSSIEVLSTDEYIAKVGECGPYQVRTQILFFFFCFVSTTQIFVTYFVVHDPPWRCVTGSKICKFNGTISSQSPLFRERCKMERTDWEYTKNNSYSVVTEFDLICDRHSYAIIANSVVFVGWSFGGIVLAYISDILGRKKTIFFSAFMMVVLSILSAIVSNIIVFITTRFLIGVYLGGGLSIIFILAAEVVGPGFRAVSCTMIWFYFTTTLFLLTFISYLVEDWKKLELIISTPFLLLMFTWWLFPESLRWLRLQGRIHDAENMLKEIARLNKRPFPNATLEPEQANTSKQASLFHLFQPRKLCIRTIVQSVSWFTAGLTYYAISLASQDLSGNFYEDFVLVSLVEMPSHIVVIVASNRYGRKKTVIGNYFIAALSCLMVATIPLDHPTGKVMKYARLVAGLIGKFAVSTYFNTLYIWSTELHPTEIRAQAVGLLVVVSRIGAALSPIVITVLKYLLLPLPFLLMAILNGIIGFLLLYLPETKDVQIVDSMQEYLDKL